MSHPRKRPTEPQEKVGCRIDKSKHDFLFKTLGHDVHGTQAFVLEQLLNKFHDYVKTINFNPNATPYERNTQLRNLARLVDASTPR